MKQRFIKWTVHLIGPAIFIFILFQVNLQDICQALFYVNPVYLILAIISQIISNILKSERWRVIIGLYEKLPFLIVLKASIYGGLYASVTPARIGEGFKAPFIKNCNLNYPQIFFSIIGDRLLDILTIILAGYFGLIYLRSIIKVDSHILTLIAIVIIATIFFVYYMIKKLRTKDFKRDVNKISTGIKKWFYENMNLVKENILPFPQKSKLDLQKMILKSISLNILSYFFYFITAYFVILAFNLDISFIFVVLIFSVVALLGILPISISGIGTRDVALISFFNILGYSSEKAIAVSMIDLFVLNYFVLILLLVVINILTLLKASPKTRKTSIL